MYEQLTRYISELENTESFGEWIVDTTSKGTHDDPIHMPWVRYSPFANELMSAIQKFDDLHPEFQLSNWRQILKDNGVSKNDRVRKEDVDIASLDGQTVMAWLFGVVRSERFCEGLFFGYCEDGIITKCLKRLRVLDADDSESSGF